MIINCDFYHRKNRRTKVCFCLFDWAPEVPVMSVPVVRFSFKPKELVLVTPLSTSTGVGMGREVFVMGRGGNKLALIPTGCLIKILLVQSTLTINHF